MGLLSGIYDSEFIQPIARIKQNLSLWTQGMWAHYLIEYQEGIPPGPASTVDMVVQAGVTTLAANGTIAKRIVTILQLSTLEFFHLRWEPLDNVEGVLWEQPGQGRLVSRNIHSRVDRNTRGRDPTLATTTFWIIGMDRDMNLECRNPMGYAIPAARFVFWGNRSILKLHEFTGEDKVKAAAGDMKTVERLIGPSTWLPTEGRQG